MALTARNAPRIIWERLRMPAESSASLPVPLSCSTSQPTRQPGTTNSLAMPV